MNTNRILVASILSIVMVLGAMAVYPVSAATINSVNVNDGGPGGQATVSISVSSTTGVSITGIDDNLSIASTQNDNGIFAPNDPDNDGHDESAGWAWSNQGAHNPSITFDVSNNAQAGDSYNLQISAQNGQTDQQTATINVAGQTTPTQGTVQRGGATFNPGTSSGNIGFGGTVFRGEDDATLPTANIDGIPDTNTEGEQLDVPVPIDLPLGSYDTDDQLNTGDEITVSNPRILKLRMYNEQGVEVTDSQIEERQNIIVVGQANYLPAEDIRLTLETDDGTQITQQALSTNPGSLSQQQINIINNQVGWTATSSTNIVDDGNANIDRSDDLSTRVQGIGNTNLNRGDVAVWHLDLDQIDVGSFNVRLEGINDFAVESPFLRDGPPFQSPPSSATDTVSLEVIGDERPNINLDRSEVTQGERVNFNIEQSTAGNIHIVTIDQSDMRENQLTNNVFIQTSDTQQIIAQGGTAYAIVRIDQDGLGIGRIDSQFLDDTSVDLTLFGAEAPGPNNVFFNSVQQAVNAINNNNLGREIDDVDLEVDEGLVSIDNPGQTYVAGDEITAMGTASQGIDEIAVYVRSEADVWHLLLTDSSSGGEWEKEDVILSDTNDAETARAANLLQLPGVKRLGIIDLEDTRQNIAQCSQAVVQNTDVNEQICGQLSTTAFNQGTSSQRSVRIVEPTLSATFQTVNGQVFQGDGLDFNGTATGVDSVAVYLLDENGNANVQLVDVDQDDDTFDEEEYSLASIDPGQATIIAASVSRDGVLGDNTLTDAGRYDSASNDPLVVTGQGYIANFANWVNTPPGYPGNLGIDDRGLTHDQILSYLVSQTTGDDGSDDLAVLEGFRFTDDSTTSINTIRPQGYTNITDRIVPIMPGETMEVMGTTNRAPDDNTIAVEVFEGPDHQQFGVATTEEWPYSSGQWSVTLEVPQNITPGNYSIEAEDGDTSDVVSFQIATERSLAEGDSEQIQELRERLQERNQTIDNLEQDLNESQQQRDQLQQQNEELNQRVSQLEQNISNLTQQPEQQQPGFTPLVAIIAFVTIALLALKRRNH